MVRLQLLGIAVALSVVSVVASAYTCKDDYDCELLGSCVSSQCVCAKGWTGPSCGSLDLSPVNVSSLTIPRGDAAAAAPAYIQWPNPTSYTDGTASAWGFTVVFDPADGLWHAFITVACGAAGVVGDGGGNSWIAHVTSSRPDGGWTFQAMVVPQTSFGPHVAVGPDGTFVHIFRVNVLNNTALCAGNGSDPLPPGTAAALLAASYINTSEIHSGDPEAGTNMYIAWSHRMTGPWSVVQVNVTGAGTAHKSNPSIQALPVPAPYTREDGTAGQATWAMAYRYNPAGGGEENAIALAEDFRGPYYCTVNVTALPIKGNSEDPFLWQQQGGEQREAGLGHILYHNGPHGYHAYGPLNGTSPWLLSPTGAYAFTLNVSVSDGTTVLLKRRERPELRFNTQDGSPAMLYNGVIGPTGAAFSMGQRIHG